MRRKSLSYADAARLMGGADDRLVAALDTALGGLLLAGTAGTSELALSLFDAKSELTMLNRKLVRALGERREGLGRLDRSDRMVAAHAVLAVSALFEALRDADLPFRDEVLECGRRTQVQLAVGEDPVTSALGRLALTLLRLDVPLPSPARTLADVEAELLHLYRQIASRLRDYVTGLAVWDSMTETDQGVVDACLLVDTPARAVRIWRVQFRRLATEFPELAFHVDRADHESTRRAVSTGLAALEERLQGLVPAQEDHQRAGLTRRYQAELGRAIVDSGDVPDYLSIPTLGEGYVDPDFRAADASSKDRLHLEEFWGQQAVQDDLAGFLVAFLCSPEATYRPLLVLGQPGAGKSVLTKFLAGKLPAGDFVVVRVVLRHGPADADVQTQVEEAIRRATGERGDWAALSRGAGDSMRVVILDGFDELLQSTGVGSSAYLRDVAKFQEIQADQGRPVAVVVTSRMAVADRALLPAEGVVAVRLEPFREEQVAHWLEIWSGRNAAGLGARGLKPLPADSALAHPDLAGQPLLLLMLALYDADDNGLQRGVGELSTPDLYERLLERFARREVAKERPALSGDEVTTAVHDELHRLSIAAMAMFHRGRQWVTQAELDDDLVALRGELTSHRDDFQAPMTPGADAVGRFFFVHRTQSRRAGEELSAVEFLHATFGEYLVARLVTNELVRMVRIAELDAPGGGRTPNLGLLPDALSFVPLTMRNTVIDSLAFRFTELPAERRELLRALLLRLFRLVVAGAAEASAGGYRPVPQTPAGRQAMHSLNLMLLVALAGDGVRASELFGTASDATQAWRATALLWYSQCSEEAWWSLTAAMEIRRRGSRGDRDLEVFWRNGPWYPEPFDPLWASRYEDLGHEPPFGWGEDGRMQLDQTGAFLNDRLSVLALDALAVLEGDVMGPVSAGFAGSFALVAPGRSVSAARALLELWTASAARRPERLAAAYETCLAVVVAAFHRDDWWNTERFLTLLLRQAAADLAELPGELLERLLDVCMAYVRDGERRVQPAAELRYWAEHVFGPGSLPHPEGLREQL